MKKFSFREWLVQLSPEPTKPITNKTRLDVQSLDMRCLPTVLHGVPVCEPPVMCHVSTPDCGDTKGDSHKASGGKCDTTKGSKAKGSSGKASGGKCDSTKSNGKGSSGKGSDGKCDLWSNVKCQDQASDAHHTPCGYGYTPKPTCEVPPPPVCPPKPPVCPPKPPVCEVPPSPVCALPAVPVCTPKPPTCDNGHNGNQSHGKGSHAKASHGKASNGKASKGKGSNGKCDSGFNVPNPKSHATCVIEAICGVGPKGKSK